MKPFQWSSKAQNLEQISDRITKASVLPQVRITYKQWLKSKSNCLAGLNKLFSDRFAVRSSCVSEDTTEFSNAGIYESYLNLDKSDLEKHILKVFESYPSLTSSDEVLVQPYLANTIISGVTFSVDPNNGSPYYIINYHDGPETDFVTSGKGGKTWRHLKSHSVNRTGFIAEVISMMSELSDLVPGEIDCEFAITSDNRLWLLQLRPLVVENKVSPSENLEIQRSLKLANDFISSKRESDPEILGDRLILGVMPDWNPAEIIGCKPLPLAMTMYKELITNEIWSYGRSKYGYKNISNTPLMYDICGTPYIDVRRSLNSLVPATLPNSIAEKLINHYLVSLERSPELHDKIEFEIVLSSFTFDLSTRLQLLRERGFSSKELNLIKKSLINLTNKLVIDDTSIWKRDQSALKILEERRSCIEESSFPPEKKLHRLIEDCKTYGTRPFSGLARIGFIGVQILNSLISKGLLSKDRADNFYSSVKTVTYYLQRDRFELDQDEFLRKYGHLRPGTYDILSPRYDSPTQQYFTNIKSIADYPKLSVFTLTDGEKSAINNELEEFGLTFDSDQLFDFIRTGIALREFSKFEFTKNLSLAFEVLFEIGLKYSFTREDLSFISVDVINKIIKNPKQAEKILKSSIISGKRSFELSQKINLPTVIFSDTDIFSFNSLPSIPNFVTNKSIFARSTSCLESADLQGKIVCIENADPGYDWLFSRKISGLITAWGGANSHMAIRSGELGIPAAIGVGEKLFRQLQVASKIKLDCMAKQIQIYG